MNAEKDLEQVAQGYRADGYEVVVRPKKDQLPPFAADFLVDLLARKDGEGVLAQVKETREEVAQDPQIPRLAEAANAEKGWRFDLVVLNPEPPVEKAARQAGEPTPEEIGRWLDEAEQVVRMGALRAAYVLAWSALEAAMRRTARAAGLNGKRGTMPRVLLNGLYSAGFLTREEFERLGQAAQLRVELVHGFVPPTFEAGLLSDLVAAARRLLTDSPQGEPVTS